MIGGLRVSVIIPCLNEASGLAAMLPQRPACVDEILVVDNGSTDDTISVAKAHGARVVSETRRGYGWACLRGLCEVSGDLIVKLDGDCTYPLAAVEPMVHALVDERLDFVSGSRFPLRDPRAMAGFNLLGNRLLSAAANRCFNLSLQDSLSGMWAVRKTAAERMTFTQGGIPFSQEIKVEAFAGDGGRARELPIEYGSRVGTSKLMPLRDGLGCLRFLLSKRCAWDVAQGRDRHPLAWWAERVAFGGVLLTGLMWPISPALKNAGLVIAVMGWIINKLINRRWPAWTPATLPMALWLLAAVASLPHSVNMATSLKGLFKIAEMVAVFLMVTDVFRTRGRIVALLTVMLVPAVIESCDGFVQVLRGTDLIYGKAAGNAPGGLRRLTATLGHANDFGIYAATVLPALLGLAMASAGRLRRFTWFVIGLMAIATLLTLSRGAALALAVAVLALLLARRAWRTLAALVVASAIGLCIMPAPLRQWAADQGSWFNAMVLPERPQMWRTALNMIRAHPLTGVGVNTFVLNYSRYKAPGDPIQSAYAHNHYLHLTAEIGLLGLAAFLWMLARAGWTWVNVLRRADRTDAWLATGLGCGVIGFLTIGLLESALFSSHTHDGFWLWLGAVYGMAQGWSAKQLER